MNTTDFPDNEIGLGIICPTIYLERFATKSWYHLVLTHKVFEDKDYAEFYKKRSLAGDYITLDNSSYEVGDGVFSNEDLLEAANRVGAHEIMANETYQDAADTLWKVQEFLGWIREYAPHLKVFGTIHGLFEADYVWLFRQYLALKLDTIGISCRLDPGDSDFGHPNDAYRKSVIRARIVKSFFPYWVHSYKPEIHLLGMNHPAELTFYKEPVEGQMVRSCDSSAAYINGIQCADLDQFDYVKPTEKLDFNRDEMHFRQVAHVDRNIQTLKRWAVK